MPATYDVAVIGFGPTGATLAALLGQRGLHVVVFDRHSEIYPKPRAVALDHEVMRVFQRLGISEEVSQISMVYPPTLYLGADGQPIQQLEPAPKPHPLSWPPTSTFNQPKLEGILRDKIAGSPNTDLYLGYNVESCDAGEDRVRVTARLDGSEPLSLEARFVVACDGAQSRTRREAGISMESLQFEEDWIVVDVMVDDAGIEKLPSTNVQYCDPDRPCTFVVCPGRHRRWEFKVLPGEKVDEELSAEFLRDLLGPWLAPGEMQIWRAAAYRFRAAVAERWRKDRTFLAGDASHQMPPFLGQGMCQGIRDAANLEWKIASALAFGASENVLNSYEIERKSHVLEVTKAVKSLGAVIGELDPAAARQRDVDLLASQGGTIKPKFRQAFIPGVFGGALLTSSPGSGKVFPQPMVRTGDAWVRLDELIGIGAFMIMQDVPEASALLEMRTISKIEEIVLLVSGAASVTPDAGLLVIHESEHLIRDWFAEHDCSAALVRPDRYVYGTATLVPGAVDLLHRFTRAMAPDADAH